jgi:hypothetical protein
MKNSLCILHTKSFNLYYIGGEKLLLNINSYLCKYSPTSSHSGYFVHFCRQWIQSYVTQFSSSNRSPVFKTSLYLTKYMYNLQHNLHSTLIMPPNTWVGIVFRQQTFFIVSDNWGHFTTYFLSTTGPFDFVNKSKSGGIMSGLYERWESTSHCHAKTRHQLWATMNCCWQFLGAKCFEENSCCSQLSQLIL